MAVETFGSCLLSASSHEALVKLGDGEIKVLEHVKSYITKQMGITEHFISSMIKLNNSSGISRPDLKDKNPFTQVWDVYYAENLSITAVLSQLTQAFNSSILKRIDKLSSYCKEAHRQYKTQRFRIDTELRIVCDEKTRLETAYEQHAGEVRNVTQKLEANKAAGKGPDKGKEDKLYKSSLKLYQNHNDYVLALTAATIHQRHYQDGVIPNLMNSLQRVKYDLALEWKRICADMANQIKAIGEQSIKLFEDVTSVLELVEDDTPYRNFLQDRREDVPRHSGYSFDESLLSIVDTDLELNEIGLFDLTLEQLKSKDFLLQQLVTETKEKLDDKSSDYQSTKHAFNELKSTSSSFESIIKDQIALVETSLELKELSCTHEKLLAQQGLVSSALEKLNGNPPKPFSNPLLSASSDSFGSPQVRSSNRTLDRLKKLHLPGISKAAANNNSEVSQTSNVRPLPRIPGEQPELEDEDEEDPNDYDEPLDVPLKEEPWYHGPIPRAEVLDLLRQDGDYLVRESARSPGQYVLSVMWQTPRHFILQLDDTGVFSATCSALTSSEQCQLSKNVQALFLQALILSTATLAAKGKFRLEGESFPTVSHLVAYHQKHQCVVTKKTNALLVHPILRGKSKDRKLSHNNIVVTDKLGRGHFGDVMRGMLKDTKQAVAIKTCRDNVLEEMKEKFLQEAEILGQYDHPNIVKLIGVAVEREPVYIVMELMEGGDFHKYLRNSNNKIDTDQQIQFCVDAASGMSYLESMGCIHRDLAARNCLLDKKKTLKISDFGMSRESNFYECSNMKEIPVKWTAPEALNYSHYTSQSDVWSFGVLLWETFSLGNTPYPGMNNKITREQVDSGYRMPPPLGTPGTIYDLMKACWNAQPEQRPKFGEILTRLKEIKYL